MKNLISVIGIGNPLRSDDAIGILLLDFLRECENNISSNVVFIDGGTGGMNLLHIITDYQVVLLIDAVQFGALPGSWKFFSLDDVINQSSTSNMSTHISDIFEVIMIAKKIGKKPPHLYVFGVQPLDLSFGQGLSEPLQKKLPDLKISLKKKLSYIVETFNS